MIEEAVNCLALQDHVTVKCLLTVETAYCCCLKQSERLKLYCLVFGVLPVTQLQFWALI